MVSHSHIFFPKPVHQLHCFVRCDTTCRLTHSRVTLCTVCGCCAVVTMEMNLCVAGLAFPTLVVSKYPGSRVRLLRRRLADKPSITDKCFRTCGMYTCLFTHSIPTQCKLDFVTEQTASKRDSRFGETGDRYLLKLLHAYIFHRVGSAYMQVALYSYLTHRHYQNNHTS